MSSRVRAYKILSMKGEERRNFGEFQMNVPSPKKRSAGGHSYWAESMLELSPEMAFSRCMYICASEFRKRIQIHINVHTCLHTLCYYLLGTFSFIFKFSPCWLCNSVYTYVTACLYARLAFFPILREQ
jgi:hypothetical protein